MFKLVFKHAEESIKKSVSHKKSILGLLLTLRLPCVTLRLPCENFLTEKKKKSSVTAQDYKHFSK